MAAESSRQISINAAAVRTARRPAEPDWFADRRREAARLAASLPAPDFRYGLNIGFDPAEVRLPRPTEPSLVQPTTVVQGAARVLPLADFWREPALARALKRHLASLPRPRHRLSAEVIAADRGSVIHVPAGGQGAVRIESRLVGRRDVWDNLIVLVEAGGSLTLTRQLASAPDSPAGRVANLEISLADGAQAQIATLQDFNQITTSFEYRQAVLNRHADLKLIDGDFGGHHVSRESWTDIVGAGAQVHCQAIFNGKDNQHFDFNETVRHAASDGRSSIFQRGALDGGARAVCRGLIQAEKSAQGCQGELKTATLLISEKASGAAIPALEIRVADAKFSHGYAIGRLDADQLFYLTSRGLTRREAERQLASSFLAPGLVALQQAGCDVRLKL